VAIFGGSGPPSGPRSARSCWDDHSALYVLGISPFWDQSIAGFLLLLAISLDGPSRCACWRRCD